MYFLKIEDGKSLEKKNKHDKTLNHLNPLMEYRNTTSIQNKIRSSISKNSNQVTNASSGFSEGMKRNVASLEPAILSVKRNCLIVQSNELELNPVIDLDPIKKIVSFTCLWFNTFIKFIISFYDPMQ